MVKICPNCGNKNYNDSVKCINCDGDIGMIQVTKDPTFNDQKPRTLQYEEHRIISIGRSFTLMGVFLSVAYIISLLVVPLLVLTSIFFFILASLIIFMGFMAIKKDEWLGLIPLIIGIIFFIDLGIGFVNTLI